MRKAGLICLILVMAVCFLTGCGNRVEVPAPEFVPAIAKDAWIIFDKYPSDLSKNITENELRQMGLKKAVLEEEVRAMNCVDVKNQHYTPVTLPVGTVVWKDGDIPVFKDSCKNKELVAVVLVPKIGAVPASKKEEGVDYSTPPAQPGPRPGSSLWPELGDMLSDILAVLIFAIAVLVALAVLAAVSWFLLNLLRRLFHPVATPSTRSPSGPTPGSTTATPPGSSPGTPWGINISFDPNGKVSIEGGRIESITVRSVDGKSLTVRAPRNIV